MKLAEFQREWMLRFVLAHCKPLQRLAQFLTHIYPSHIYWQGKRLSQKESAKVQIFAAFSAYH